MRKLLESYFILLILWDLLGLSMIISLTNLGGILSALKKSGPPTISSFPPENVQCVKFEQKR